jgi:squalene-hopene/tetraprenyl-beta-curcumene cyclase
MTFPVPKTSFAVLTACLLQSVCADPLPLSLRNEGQDAVRRGIQWLQAKQAPEGSWSNPEWPALTGLALWALDLSSARESEEAAKAVEFIKSKAHEDGSIFVEPNEKMKGGGKSNYNTAICMIALHLTGREDVRPLVLKARRFVAASQHLGGDVYHGGFGYDAQTDRVYADLSNTYMAMEAMAITQNAEDFRTDGNTVKIDKAAAAEFVSSIQNRKESNPAAWVSDEPSEAGGFAYHPEESKAGTFSNETGKVFFRSFGSMTYAGILSLIYADVDRSDPRVKSAIDWSTRFWSLEENPGMGQQGLFYFYNILSKCLAVYGQDNLRREDGTEINWRAELVKKLVGLQKIDEQGMGYWQNNENRFWENDPVLVSAYTLIALQLALQE